MRPITFPVMRRCTTWRKKVEQLRWRLHRRTQMREDWTPFPDQYSSTGSDESYLPWSRTLPSESFMLSSHRTFGQKQYRKRSRTPPRRGQGHDAMGNFLLQISRSHFSLRIEQVELLCCFNQATFIIYNGRTDPVEHVSHFNQSMAIYSKN